MIWSVPFISILALGDLMPYQILVWPLAERYFVASPDSKLNRLCCPKGPEATHVYIYFKWKNIFLIKIYTFSEQIKPRKIQ